MVKRRRNTSDTRYEDDGGNGKKIRGGGGGGGTGGGDGGDNGGDKGNEGTNNEKRQNKGKVPQEFADCRICDGKFHWESDCRKNAIGVGKRAKDSPKCRLCTGNHWEDQCRTWKARNPGANNNNNNNNNRPENANPGKFLAPTGEDITQFFPKGKFPRRPFSKCNVLGHWNDACEKEGFDPVTNPNPGAKNEKEKEQKVHFQDDFDANQPPPGTQRQKQSQQPQEQQSQKQQQSQKPQAHQQLPPVNFGYAQKQTQYNPNYSYLPGDPRNPNHNTNSYRPDYIDPNTSPFQVKASAGPLHPLHPSHPDSSYYRTTYRSQTCTYCHEPGHKSNDCKTFLWLLPRTSAHWRPHPDLNHPSNALRPRHNGYWNADPTKVPSANTYIWPHPRNTHQGVVWGENSYDYDGGGVKDVWVGQDDLEGGGDGRRLRWGTPPGGVGCRELGGMCRFDGEGDVVMVDILDFEGRRERGRRWREESEERNKPWWMRGGGEFDFEE